MCEQDRSLWRWRQCSDGFVSVTLVVEFASLVSRDGILLPLRPAATEGLFHCPRADKIVQTSSHAVTWLVHFLGMWHHGRVHGSRRGVGSRETCNLHVASVPMKPQSNWSCGVDSRLFLRSSSTHTSHHGLTREVCQTVCRSVWIFECCRTGWHRFLHISQQLLATGICNS